MGGQRARHRPRGRDDLRGHAQDLVVGGWRHEQRSAALGAAPDAQAGGDGDQARARDYAQQQRLADLRADQPALLDGRRAGGDEPAGDVQGPAGMAGEAEVPEGERVADGRGHHDRHEREHQQGHGGERHRRVAEAVGQVARGAPVLGIEVRLVGDVEQEAQHHAEGDEAREREGRKADPARIQARELDLGLLRGRWGGRARDGGGVGRRRLARAVQQLRAQRGGLRRGEAVEPHAASLLAIRAPGPDLDTGQREEPMHRACGDVDRPDAVARDGAHAAPEEARADLDAVLGQAVARREPARQRQAERDDERDRDPDEALAAAAARDEDREQRREGARDLLNGMDEEHAAIEPPPGAAIGRRHVPSPRVA
jgi:hypothetical protein